MSRIRQTRRYRRRREQCRGCHRPIDREPTTDGNLYGWTPESGRCYECTLVDLFGPAMQPDENWWRAIRKITQAAWHVAEAMVPDGPPF